MIMQIVSKCFLLSLFLYPISVCGQSETVFQVVSGPIHNKYCTYFLSVDKTIYFNEDYDYLPLQFILLLPYPTVKCYSAIESANYLFMIDTLQFVFLTYDYSTHRMDTLAKSNHEYYKSFVVDDRIHDKISHVIEKISDKSECYYAYRDDVLLFFFNVKMDDINKILRSFCVLRKQQKKRR